MDPLTFIISELGYKKAAKIDSLPAEQKYELLNFAFANSIKGTYAILFAPSSLVQITPYGMSWGIAYSALGSDHYLIMHPQLNEKFFRQIFTSLEMIIFKICHIFLERMRHDYTFDESTTYKRMKRLKALLPVENWNKYFKSFDDFWYVRDAFSHTFIDLEDIRYRGVPLKACFGQTYTGALYDQASFTFVEDTKTVFEPILKLFMTKQIEQIDSSKFFSICDAALRPRSLGR